MAAARVGALAGQSLGRGLFDQFASAVGPGGGETSAATPESAGKPEERKTGKAAGNSPARKGIGAVSRLW